MARPGVAVVLWTTPHALHFPLTRNGAGTAQPSPGRELAPTICTGLTRLWRYRGDLMPGMASKMDERLRRLAGAARRSALGAQDARSARDAAIAEAESLGWSLAAIAERTGLSIAQVGRIAVARTQQAQDEQPTERIDVR